MGSGRRRRWPVERRRRWGAAGDGDGRAAAADHGAKMPGSRTAGHGGGRCSGRQRGATAAVQQAGDDDGGGTAAAARSCSTCGSRREESRAVALIPCYEMYSPPCTSPGNSREQSFVAGANPLALLDHAMDFDEHSLFPMHNVGMQDGVQFYNPTTGTELSRNMSMERSLKGGKRKGSGEGSSSMHSQEETGAMPQREVNMERAGDAESNREDYVHIRAKRGQATNNHSLAERFRREKINERMKHLQDLVPGCNKITGKAMMLDEIINYVQSLQRQVEFLSMKLSAVSPELNCDLDLQDILCPQDARSVFPGYGPRLSNVHPSMYRASQTGLSSRPELYGHGIIPNPADVHMARTAQLSAFPQRGVVWDEELGNIGPVAFPLDAGASSLENSDRLDESGVASRQLTG